MVSPLPSRGIRARILAWLRARTSAPSGTFQGASYQDVDSLWELARQQGILVENQYHGLGYDFLGAPDQKQAIEAAQFQTAEQIINLVRQQAWKERLPVPAIFPQNADQEPSPLSGATLEELEKDPATAGLSRIQIAVFVPPPPTYPASVYLHDTLARHCRVKRLLLAGDLEDLLVVSLTVAGIPVNLGSKPLPAVAFSNQGPGIPFENRLAFPGQQVSVQLLYKGAKPRVLVSGGLICDELLDPMSAQVMENILRSGSRSQ